MVYLATAVGVLSQSKPIFIHGEPVTAGEAPKPLTYGRGRTGPLGDSITGEIKT